MPLSLELRLVERRSDSLVVAVSLIPSGSSRVEGVALELHGPREQGVGARVLLPIAGALLAPIHTQAELSLPDDPPPGLTVVATAWCGDEEVAASCPADPCIGLDTHLRGCPCALPPRDAAMLDVLTDAERDRLAEHFPWLSLPVVIDGDQESGEAEDADDELADLCDQLGLDDESADWLKELLAEDL